MGSDNKEKAGVYVRYLPAICFSKLHTPMLFSSVGSSRKDGATGAPFLLLNNPSSSRRDSGSFIIRSRKASASSSLTR